ncbi:MAG: VWA domain-containing protein [Deltaproteobacteria bacterium]|nr:MAG: VWA domain-containing protein [Deltaproteobacteria bacterium]
MNEKLLEFSNLLRQNGLRVSLAENMDTFRALSVVGLGDRETVRATLRASMVKRGVDIPTYEQLFTLFFSGLADAIAQSTAATRGALGLDDPDFQRLLEELERLLRERGIELSPLARALLAADGGRLERLLREAGEQGRLGDIQQGFQEGRFSHAIASALGLGALAREIQRLKEELQGSADADRLSEYLDRRLQDLNDMIKAMVRGELERQDVGRRDHERLAALADKSFFYLTEEEIRRMQEAVQKLAQRLRNVISIRRRRARRGKFDPSATLRRNLQYGGVPFRIVWDRRKKEKPQVMVLCDVSDSVRNVSRFMLQFVYSLQDLYSKVRSFIFVSDVGEITRLFEEQDIHQAIETALRGDVINVYAHSDFGRAFKGFHRDHIAAVNKRTTVIVLGDARNNYNLPHDWVLKEIRQRAKQLIWLNPENRMTWGFGDSEMDHYGPHCTLVEECRNLGQLYRVIDRLVAS